jgi:hypothetical protein
MQLIIPLDPDISVSQTIEGRSAHTGQPRQGGLLATPLIAAVKRNESPDYFNAITMNHSMAIALEEIRVHF